ncbi:MAG: TIGR03086 family metal-binding protein [Acidimicrobiales bacterium]
MTTTNTTEPTTDATLADDDPRRLFAIATAATRGVVEQVRPDQLEAPTPCTDFDVRELLGHLLFVLDRVDVMGQGRDPMTTPEITPPADDAWVPAFAEAAHRVQDTWSRPGVLEIPVALPWAQGTAGEMLLGYLNELTVHTWDLAAATGVPVDWDDDVIAAAQGAISSMLPPEGRLAMFEAMQADAPPEARFSPPFAERVEVDADAAPIERLVAYNGRRP